MLQVYVEREDEFDILPEEATSADRAVSDDAGDVDIFALDEARLLGATQLLAPSQLLLLSLTGNMCMLPIPACAAGAGRSPPPALASRSAQE